MDKPKLIDKRAVSEEYGIPVSTQEVLTAKGDFCAHLKVGNKWYYQRAELEQWLDSRRVATPSQAIHPVEAEATSDVTR